MVQQVEPVLDVPVAGESPVAADKGQDIFSALLFLALTGNCCAGSEGLKDVYPLPPSEDQAQGHQDTSSSVPAVGINPSMIGEQDFFLSENNPLLPVAMLRGNGSPAPLVKGGWGDLGGLGFLGETFTGLRPTKDNENSLSLRERDRVRVGLFSGEPPMPLQGTKEHENPSPSPPPIKGGGMLDDFSNLPSGVPIAAEGQMQWVVGRGLEYTDPVNLPMTEDGVIEVRLSDFFKDGEHQGNCGTDSSDKKGREGIAESGLLTHVMKASVHTDNSCNLQPIHKYIDQEKIIQHLSQRLIHASHAGTHTARIRLKPEELGDICMDISVIDNNVKAFIAVENYDVKEIVEANLNRLEEELKNHGLRIEQFTVEMKGGGPGDRFMSASHWKDTFNKRGAGRILFDSGVNQGSLNDPVITGSGVISIFA